MNHDRYPFSAGVDNLDFKFESEGPNGKIMKVITFTPKSFDGVRFFSLAFGDWDNDLKSINDNAVSNNKDRPKILATVASAVLKFTEHFPEAPVYAIGSTQSRTRLYQMGISANLNEIETIFDVLGYTDGGWEPFRKNVNYDAFLVQRKRNI